MSHLPARPRNAFAIEVHRGARNIEPTRCLAHFLADQVHHLDLAAETYRLGQRPASDSPDMLLELGNSRAVNSPVTGVMNPWRDFIDQQYAPPALAHDEHFNREHADIVERLCDPARDLACLARE